MYIRLLAVAAVLLVCIGPAHADTTYKLVFTGSAGTEIGSGTLSLNAAPPSGNSTFYEAADPDHTEYTVTSFSATVDGYTFDLSSESRFTSATFKNGELTDLEYQDFPNAPPISGFVVFFGISGSSFTIGNSLAPFPNDNGTFTATPASVPFCKLSAALEATIDPHRSDSLVLEATFSPGVDGVVNPSTQAVSITVGTYSFTIPAGSFQMSRVGYLYQGSIGGVNIDFVLREINPPGTSSCSTATYTLIGTARGAALSSLTNPVRVEVSIGNNTGAEEVTALLEP